MGVGMASVRPLPSQRRADGVVETVWLRDP